MTWLAFVAGAFLSWGVYGSMLHDGQMRLGSPMRALLCVGVAYFLIGVLVPLGVLYSQGEGLKGFNSSGTTMATVAGALGAIGAACIIFAFRTGGTPQYARAMCDVRRATCDVRRATCDVRRATCYVLRATCYVLRTRVSAPPPRVRYSAA
jgi:hypothetical protein